MAVPRAALEQPLRRRDRCQGAGRVALGRGAERDHVLRLENVAGQRDHTVKPPDHGPCGMPRLYVGDLQKRRHQDLRCHRQPDIPVAVAGGAHVQHDGRTHDAPIGEQAYDLVRPAVRLCHRVRLAGLQATGQLGLQAELRQQGDPRRQVRRPLHHRGRPRRHHGLAVGRPTLRPPRCCTLGREPLRASRRRLRRAAGSEPIWWRRRGWLQRWLCWWRHGVLRPRRVAADGPATSRARAPGVGGGMFFCRPRTARREPPGASLGHYAR
mmetsp:Transcript_78273/g.203989  ORF Transcript_78273/g.203989 Transcript_78273/m.203989 type:complete len:268 (-) Transcript_78273:18-821(-)